jgi:hypothetical protein
MVICVTMSAGIDDGFMDDIDGVGSGVVATPSPVVPPLPPPGVVPPPPAVLETDMDMEFDDPFGVVTDTVTEMDVIFGDVTVI